MQIQKHIYAFNYASYESQLCKLESRCLFNKEEKNKWLLSDIKVEPSSSAFIKKRLDVIFCFEDYFALIDRIKRERLCIEGFKVEYLVLDGDTIGHASRLAKIKGIGVCIIGTPEYRTPIITYALCYCEGFWYFGTLIKDDFDWYKHKQKPYSFSNSLNINIAKALVNIVAQANQEKKLLDACCGVGTVMLEACFSGYSIDGCDINWKVCRKARENLSYFNYTAHVYRSDIKDVSLMYDAAIIDLPYNLLSCATDENVLHIIESTAALTDRLVMVSISDITNFIHYVGFSILDQCSVTKRGKTVFARRIWLCEKNK